MENIQNPEMQKESPISEKNGNPLPAVPQPVLQMELESSSFHISNEILDKRLESEKDDALITTELENYSQEQQPSEIEWGITTCEVPAVNTENSGLNKRTAKFFEKEKLDNMVEMEEIKETANIPFHQK